MPLQNQLSCESISKCPTFMWMIEIHYVVTVVKCTQCRTHVKKKTKQSNGMGRKKSLKICSRGYFILHVNQSMSAFSHFNLKNKKLNMKVFTNANSKKKSCRRQKSYYEIHYEDEYIVIVSSCGKKETHHVTLI